MKEINTPTSISVIGFFTFWMFWTLDAGSGQDMNDVVVKYVNAQAVQIEQTNRHVVEVK